MTVKELKEVLANLADNAEVIASDWETSKIIRGLSTADNNCVVLRLWKTDEETFEEERKQAEVAYKNTEYLLKVNGKNKRK